mmetsp:Transcript_123497/g.231011  ORF Transcript_123497/g.231011 Transcript_123497/m.231011 type:complete len:201 (-) Transcript_123497:199-801(-)
MRSQQTCSRLVPDHIRLDALLLLILRQRMPHLWLPQLRLWPKLLWMLWPRTCWLMLKLLIHMLRRAHRMLALQQALGRQLRKPLRHKPLKSWQQLSRKKPRARPCTLWCPESPIPTSENWPRTSPKTWSTCPPLTPGPPSLAQMSVQLNLPQMSLDKSQRTWLCKLPEPQKKAWRMMLLRRRRGSQRQTRAGRQQTWWKS